MKTIKASIHYEIAPPWALLERKLIDVLNEAIHPYIEKYTHKDGSLIWADTWTGGRDGMDDFYEAFTNFAQFYILGGGDHLLAAADKHWDAITQQLTGFGRIYKEFERGYDQFHQSESYIYFYHLCLADPENPKLQTRARRFAGFYLNEFPDALNYDPEHRLIRAPHNGSGGPAWGMSDDDSLLSYNPGKGGMRVYGLPLSDVPGITHVDDLEDPMKAREMGRAMASRYHEGDVGNNLNINGLIMNAYLITGDEKYRNWLLEYVEAWLTRARENEGLMPDNVGLDGKVGTLHNGKWYGGLYGWTWPHGFYSLGFAAITAANNAYMLTGDSGYFDLPRGMIDCVLEEGIDGHFDEMAEQMSLREHFIAVDRSLGPDRRTFLTPYRYGDQGWMDYQPMPVTYPLNIWNVSEADEDWRRIEYLRERSGYDWSAVVPFRDKGDMHHDEPWLLYLRGQNADYPEQILGAAYAQVCHRLAQIRADDSDLEKGSSIHLWQQVQPVTTEALVQLTMGCPQVIYYGGILNARLRYYDVDRNRPGLPDETAALIDKIEPSRVGVSLVNLHHTETRQVVIQAGGLAEHKFGIVKYNTTDTPYPGSTGAYAAPVAAVKIKSMPINDSHLLVVLPPATCIYLDMEIDRYVNQPRYLDVTHP